jgi:anhydro-N-acetylmuramic acid kinase
MLIIGLMSGTSADGIDAALTEIVGEGGQVRVALRHFLCLPHTPALRDAVLRLCDPLAGAVPDLCALHFALGERFAQAAQAVAHAAGIPLTQVDAIASHGQTVWHQPSPYPVADTAATGTLQIGCPAVIAARTGCTVISDFRSADMALGGHGAPLVPYADWLLFASSMENRAVQNIGGIANVTFLPKDASLESVIAFDTGPGNMLIDGLARALSKGARQYDENEAQAAQGFAQERLSRWLWSACSGYLDAPPPKTTGRERFGEPFLAQLLSQVRAQGISDADALATVTAFTAETIAHAYRLWLTPQGGVQTVIVGGGGARNATLMRLLRERLAPARLTTHAEFGIPDDAKEAIAFALLGYETLRGQPANVPRATGASRPAILGSITPKPPRKEPP